MAKKQFFSEDEVPVFGNRNGAVIFRRGENWQFRVWLTADNRYVQKSLNTKILETAKARADELYLELYANIEKGVKFYSSSVKESVQNYVDYRATEVRDDPSQNGIVKGRLETIKTHLRHFLDFVGRETRLSQLEEGQLLAYPKWCRTTRKTISDSTVRNEMSTVNSCISYLYDKKIMSSFRHFQLPKHTRTQVDVEKVKRETFTADEYNAFTVAMRQYVKEQVDDDELYARQLVRSYFLIAANSGMRSGELAQLTWQNIEILDINKETKIAKITVQAATSKVGKSRIFMHRGGFYYERWRELYEQRNAKVQQAGIIFSIDGKRRYPQSSLHKHFKRMMALSDIDENRKQQLVPYSFRHFAITNRVQSGLKLQEVAKMTGTSVKQVEETYWHINDQQMKRAALADFVIDKNGTIIPTM